MNNHPVWMTVSKAATVLGVEPQRLKEMVEQGQFPEQYVKRSGDRYIFHPKAVDPPMPLPTLMSPELIHAVIQAASVLNDLVQVIAKADTRTR